MGKKDGEPFESWAEAETVISEALDRWRKVQDEAEAAYQALIAIRQRVTLTKIADKMKRATPTLEESIDALGQFQSAVKTHFK